MALSPAVTPTHAAPPAPGVHLGGGGHAKAGAALRITAKTSLTLAGAGGHFALELRGIDLTAAKRATYARPDYTGKRCTATPCSWSVARSGVAYEFRAFLIDLRNGKSAERSLPLRTWWARAQPHALTLLINGKHLPTTALTSGVDHYNNIAAGPMHVVAHWTTDARGTGDYVAISTLEPQVKNFASCSTGTSCVVTQQVPILHNQEVSWQVEVLTKRGHKLVRGFRICLNGV
jgi:hypothetical protein